MSDDAAAAPESSDERDGERDQRVTLGERLRDARLARDLSIEKIADELRIEEHILVALEEDRLADIDIAPVFIKGYIKQYGRLLRLDYDELRAAFYEQIGAEDISLRPNTSIYLRDERQITVWIVAALAVLLVGVALLVWWLGTEDMGLAGLLGRSDETADVPAVVSGPVTLQSRTSPAPVAVAAPEPASAPVSETAPNSTEPLPSAAAGEIAAGETATGATPDSGAAPVPGAGREPAAAGQPGAGQTDSAANLAQPGAPVIVSLPATPEPGSIATEFVFSGESWFELEDANARRLYYDLAPAGSRLSFAPLPPVRVLIGDADVVSITVEARPYAIPAGSLRGNVASFVIEPPQD